ncbi:MAG TPA: inositol monophosphatase family protein [Candidatus Limnocylindria bacterium]|nr:inositol monophosphatase family protein [Candidatus Limnocylindria bacterium]
MTDPDVARAAAEAGAAVVRARFGGEHERYAKGGLDFATDVDIEAERAIIEVLQRLRPQDHVIGEEIGHVPGDVEGRTWLVDPLCGTANFAAGVQAVAVNVALPAAAVAAVAIPFSQEVIVVGPNGARMHAADGESPLSPSGHSRIIDFDLDQRPTLPGFQPLDLMADAEFRSTFQPRVTSTSLALTWVAIGRRAGYVTDGQLADNVHFAAGVTVCLAAGCVVSDLHGRPVTPGAAASGMIAAADEQTQARLLALVRRLQG